MQRMPHVLLALALSLCAAFVTGSMNAPDPGCPFVQRGRC